MQTNWKSGATDAYDGDTHTHTRTHVRDGRNAKNRIELARRHHRSIKWALNRRAQGFAVCDVAVTQSA